MKRVIFFSLLCCMLLAFLIQAGSCITATINVVKNPSFEEGDKDWIMSAGSTGKTEVKTITNAPDGDKVLYIDSNFLCSIHFNVSLCGNLIYVGNGDTGGWKEVNIDISDY